MKIAKRAAALLLALLLVLSLGASAFAEDTTYTITINNATAGHTYMAYQIFTGDLSISSDEEKVLSNIEWGSGINKNGQSELLNYDSSGYADAAAVAATLTNDNVKTFIEKWKSYKASAYTLEQNGNQYKATDVPAGYYVILDRTSADYDFVSDYIVQVVGDVEISPKGSLPRIEKIVGYGGQSGKTVDCEIGSTVTFMVSFCLPTNITDYEKYEFKLEDTMGEGFSFNKLTGVNISGQYPPVHLSNNITSSCELDVTESSSATSITVTCSDLITALKKAGMDVGSFKGETAHWMVRFAYTATLNEYATIGGAGNRNKACMTYSADPNDENIKKVTTADEVAVFTYQMDVNKVDGDNGKVLSNAKFVLLDSTKNKVAKVTNGKLAGWGSVSTTSDEATKYTDGTVMVTNTEGAFSIAGLDAGTYYLHETEAPAGYNKLNTDIKLVIEAEMESEVGLSLKTLNIKVDEVTEKGSVSNGAVTVRVENQSGAVLPSTGGVGTTVFYIVGGLLVVSAGVVLVTRKRMSKSED